MSTPRLQSQLDTPKEWVTDGKMFRIKSWEIEKEEIDTLVKTLIQGEYSINVIHSKEGELKGITLLYVKDPEDAEKIRTTLLVTSSGTELRKTHPLRGSIVKTRTIKTTAPNWITKKRLLNVFSKYNSDPKRYDIAVDGTVIKGIRYPVIRFHPTNVTRNGVITPVKVVYIEFSPDPECIHDSFIAYSMEHRHVFKNPLSGEEATLIFDEWLVEKINVKDTEKLVLRE